MLLPTLKLCPFSFASDGHRFVETKKKDDVKVVSCTRWTEIQVG